MRLYHRDGLLSLGDIGWSWEDTQVLGGGSNILFTRNPSRVLRMATSGKEVSPNEKLVTVAAGENWDALVDWTLKQGFYGLENLSWIPGSVGAAPMQNIGAYGVEVSQFIDAVEFFDPSVRVGQFHWVRGAECGFGYRDSFFKSQWAHCIITRVRFRLSAQFQPVLSYGPLQQLVSPALTAPQVRQAVICTRQSKLPDPSLVANAGSFFKNPVIDKVQAKALCELYPDLPSFSVSSKEFVKIPAAWLLDRAGFKGRSCGDFGCFEHQPLVMVHYQTKGALPQKRQRLMSWIQEIQDKVYSMYGISLEIEPVLV